MGVIYKLKEEVVQFIISQRQSNPLASCRQLAESASQKFDLHLSKSSVHDVLKESGIITPRGRKPKDAFKIPQAKKKQIQESLSLVKLISPPSAIIPPEEPKLTLIADITETNVPVQNASPEEVIVLPAQAMVPSQQDSSVETLAEYDGAGKIFLKAALWDLGFYSEESIKDEDRKYYLTYSKGIKVDLENGKSFFINMLLPLERCIKEVADGLINNIRPLVIDKVSDEILFKACMEAQPGHKITVVSIVDCYDHILSEFSSLVEYDRTYYIINRIFVEINEIDPRKRSKMLFFSQAIDNDDVINSIIDLKGFDTININDRVVTLIIDGIYENKALLEEAVEKLNGMFLRDEQNRLVKVQIQA